MALCDAVAEVDVTSTIVVARPRAEVAAFAVDPDNATAWYRNITSVRWVSSPPVAVGSRIAFVAEFLGRRLEYTYQVREFEPGRRFVMSTDQGPFPMETTYTWADGPGGTSMSLHNRGTPSGFARIGAPVLAAAMRRANAKDLEALKAVLEGRGSVR